MATTMREDRHVINMICMIHVGLLNLSFIKAVRYAADKDDTCMTICKRCMQVIELESHPLFAHISIMAWMIRILWSNTDFKSVT